MAVLSFRDVSFGFGQPPLVEHADLQVERGERIGLLGRNGTGKSTLMRLMLGELAPDHGTIETANGIRITRQRQDVPVDARGTIFGMVAAAFEDHGPALEASFRLHHHAEELTVEERHQLETLAATVDSDRAWQWEQRIEQTLARMQLDPWQRFENLSSGMKRRVLLAQALVLDPDILLLDEPTNHLDIEAINWLEDFLQRFEGTFIFITHDRTFLQKLATRIVELDCGKLYDWTCDYATFLIRKEEALAAEERQQELFDKKLAREEAWIRTGIKARRTRNEGRVRALKELRSQYQARRKRVGSAQVELHEDADRGGVKVIQAANLNYAIAGRTILENFSTTIFRGDKIGIIGPNGCGKTTLLRLLLGELTPTAGTIRHGTNLEIGYFDQLRAQLDDEETVIENVAHGQDMLLINGKRRHIIGYLEDFLFTPERSKTLVRFLSGGERNRLLLARLFSKPSNVLVLDEPTNDLDTETLELLESLVVDYPGTVLLVSHDRTFLNNVITSSLVFEGDNGVKEYAGGYDDWLLQKTASVQAEAAAKAKSAGETRPVATPTRSRLNFKEQRELEELPRKIEAWETEQADLHAQMGQPSFYQQDTAAITAVNAALARLEESLTAAYARWEELESRAE
ncbi:MAG TPA: ATP-binding cassette domain-containing protein [Planctomycetaceae bacterium]|nr:ATP-binding cassette domain-containing protein [Planctomycetaceae bacterium]